MDARSLTETLRSVIATPNEELFQEPGAKRELVTALRALTTKIEDPVDVVNRLNFQPAQNAAVRIAIDLNLFVLVDRQEGAGLSAKHLESLTGAEAALIVRIMRILTAAGIFAEASEQHYLATPISKAWTAPPLRALTQHLFDDSGYTLFLMPAFLKQNGYKNPVDNANGPFQYAFKTDQSFFAFLNQRPERLDAFNTCMEGQRDGRTSWFEYYPFEKSVAADVTNKDEALIVDAGGGRGHELEALKTAFPDAPGRMIVQDLPETIEGISGLKPGIEAMKFDFFNPQPVKDAKAYYFRNVFHDWPDDKCRTILRHTVGSMKKDYSLVLINDWVLPDRDSSWFSAAMDLNMMAMVSGMERTVKHWHALLNSVGLEIVKIWTKGPEMESLIEATIS